MRMALLLACLSAPLHAAPESAPMLVDNAVSLRGQGMGTYLMFDVYEARLYAPSGLPAQNLLASSTPRRLSLSYKVDLKSEQIVEASMTTLQTQWPQDKLARIQPGLSSLNAAMRDVRPGDVYTLDYHPKQGLRLRLNDQEIWRGGDAELAEAYFGIWLRQPALSESLRLALLGLE